MPLFLPSSFSDVEYFTQPQKDANLVVLERCGNNNEILLTLCPQGIILVRSAHNAELLSHT